MPEQRRHAAIMFTDIVGYTRLMGSDEEKAVDMLSRNRSIHQSCIEKFNGTLIKEIGDGILASFSLASEAVRCAIEIQKECKEREIPLKIGIHEGEMIFSGTDVIGDGVNIASRLQEDAQEGCINISASVYRDIKNKADIQTKLVGERSFKNVDEPIKVYKVLCEEEDNEEELGKKNTVKKSSSKLLYYILAGFASIFVAYLLWKYIPSKIPIKGEKTIAVLPFANMSESDEYSYFGDALTDEIIMQLQKIKDLKVRSNTSVMKYKEGDKSIPEISEELNVNYVIEGAAQRFGNNVRIRVQLIDAISDEHVWGETYEKEWDDIFKLQGNIAKEIASELEAILTPSEIDKIESIPTENLKAYELYLRGRDYHLKGGETNINAAIHFYTEAIELDPEFAQVYVWLGKAYHDQTYWSDYFKETLGDTLIYFADKALSLNSELADAYWLRGVYYQQKGNFDLSTVDLEKAIEHNPNYGDAYWMLAYNYTFIGQFTVAYVFGKKAKTAKIGDPDYPNLLADIGFFYSGFDREKSKEILSELTNYDPMKAYSYLANLSLGTGDHLELKMYCDNLCALDSGSNCYWRLGYYYMLIKDYNQALKFFNRSRDIEMNEGNLLWFIRYQHRYAYVLYNLNSKEEAEIYFQKQIEYCEESIRLKRPYALDGGAYFDLAGIYSFLGQQEKAIDILLENEDAIAFYYLYMQNDPLYESLWIDERFIQLIQRLEKRIFSIKEEIDRVEATEEL